MKEWSDRTAVAGKEELDRRGIYDRKMKWIGAGSLD